MKSASSNQNLSALTQILANCNEGFIYFWSFISETLIPDINYSKTANFSIIYDDGKTIEWVAGIAFENYPDKHIVFNLLVFLMKETLFNIISLSSVSQMC